MTIYDELSDVASEVLSDFKQGSVNLVKITSGSGPADNPGASTEVEHSLNATVKGVSFKYITQGLAAGSDLEVTSGILSNVTPSEKDFIEIDDIRYKIVQFMPIPAAGTKIAWKFIVRKGG